MRFPIPFWFRRFALFYTYYFALDLLPSSNDDHLHRHAHTSRPPQRIRVAHGDISIKPEPSETSSPIYHTVTVVTIHPISDRRTATGVLYANRARNHGELGDVTLHLSVYLRRPRCVPLLPLLLSRHSALSVLPTAICSCICLAPFTGFYQPRSNYGGDSPRSR